MIQRTADNVPSAPPHRPGASRGSGWGVPAALVLLSIVPVVAGSLRLFEIVSGQHLLPDNPRIDAAPAPVIVHIIAAALYALVGTLQFSGRLRRRRPHWHRASGRALTVAGLTVAASGLWMTLFYTDAPGGDVLWAARLMVATVMAGSILLGFTAIRRRDIAAHRAWMIRAFALGVGAGTQTLTQGLGEALFGTSSLSTGLSISSAWAINAVVAEWVIRSPVARRSRRARAQTALAGSW